MAATVEDDLEQLHLLTAEKGANLLFLGEAGSRVSGTHTQESDHDYLGFVVASSDQLVGMYAWKDLNLTTVMSTDCAFQELSHLIQLLHEGNIHIIEALWGHPESVIFRHHLFESFWTTSRLSSIVTAILADRYLFKCSTLVGDREAETTNTDIPLPLKQKRYCFTVRTLLTALFLVYRGCLRVFFDLEISSFLTGIKTCPPSSFDEDDHLTVCKILLKLLQEGCGGGVDPVSEKASQFIALVIAEVFGDMVDGSLAAKTANLPQGLSCELTAELSAWVFEVRTQFDSNASLYYSKLTEHQPIFKTAAITVVEGGARHLLDFPSAGATDGTSLVAFINQLLEPDLTALSLLLVPEHEAIIFAECWKQFRSVALTIALDCNFIAAAAVREKSPIVRCFLAQRSDDRAFHAAGNEIGKIWTQSYQNAQPGYSVSEARHLFHNWLLRFRNTF
eukprot:TRINITY_DN11437_c0_g1_i1.p1 TRINITY_DN11437_c0_g1~~TRINITY_DN11437_c0_g1_i1.p1  ORF type:complete len:449 (+),score=70.58 TRINITY_DN11437_c0_g1_i1:53-1399(+)